MPELPDSKAKDEVKSNAMRFGIPLAVGVLVVILFITILVNIPPIPLPFTDNKLYIINLVFAEQFKFYAYFLLYFTLIFLFLKGFTSIGTSVFTNFKKYSEKLKHILDSLI